ncbi:MAG TPA: hypothetical protein DEA78_09215, partial [Cyanobacteria bacterium UBA11159]|nr:hypothetical protein [Cyanobacteria bacterium UBA11159]
MTKKITKLTPEEEALIPVYYQKWHKNLNFCEPIDKEEVTLALKSAYRIIDMKEAEIIFFDSPFAAVDNIVSAIIQKIETTSSVNRRRVDQTTAKLGDTCNQLGNSSWRFWFAVERKIWDMCCESGLITVRDESSWQDQIFKKIEDNLELELNDRIGITLLRKIRSIFFQRKQEPLMEIIIDYCQQQIREILLQKTNLMFDYLIGEDSVDKMLQEIIYNYHYRNRPNKSIFDSWHNRAAFIDFCVSVLNCPINQNKWSLFQSLLKQWDSMFQKCDWLFAFEDICLVCNRPLIFSCDNQNRLHGEGSPAIQFADGYTIYAHHGVSLPKSYGEILPNQWHPEWILSETNTALKKLLIQNIGYKRICQELPSVVLDTWQEYTLLEIEYYQEEIVESEDDFDFEAASESECEDPGFEPMYLLKMTASDTGGIDVWRVPPTIKSAKEAITWVNWGISPEE